MPSPQKRAGTGHSSSAFSGAFSPEHNPASLILPEGAPHRALSRNLEKSTHVSAHSHMSPPSSNTSTMDINRQSGVRGGGEERAADNTENRFELFLLGDGEKKVTEEADTRKLALDYP